MDLAKERFNANRHSDKLLPLVLGALLALVSACTVGPNYSRPTVTTPANYKEALTLSAAQSIDAVVKANWWELFVDPELNAVELQLHVPNENTARDEAR